MTGELSMHDRGGLDYAELDPELEHLNEEHGDTVVFVSRHLAGVDADLATASVSDARLVSVDQGGLRISVDRDDGPSSTMTVPFEQTPSSLDEVRLLFFQALGHARAAAGDTVPPTSLEREMADTQNLRTYVGEVVRSIEVTPNVLEVTIGGLDGYEAVGGDEFVFILAPPPGRRELTVGTDFTWDQYRSMSDEDRPRGAYYTVRRWRPDRHEMDLWFVLHDGGQAAGWAASARPGDPVAIWGPRRAFHPPTDVDTYLLVADETGAAAVAAILDQMEAQTERPGRVHVILECVDEDHEIDMPVSGSVDVTWHHRGFAEPGSGAGFVPSVRALDLDTERVYVFGAGESRQMTALRKFVRQDVGLPAERVSVTGYWRKPVA